MDERDLDTPGVSRPAMAIVVVLCAIALIAVGVYFGGSVKPFACDLVCSPPSPAGVVVHSSAGNHIQVVRDGGTLQFVNETYWHGNGTDVNVYPLALERTDPVNRTYGFSISFFQSEALFLVGWPFHEGSSVNVSAFGTTVVLLYLVLNPAYSLAPASDYANWTGRISGSFVDGFNFSLTYAEVP